MRSQASSGSKASRFLRRRAKNFGQFWRRFSRNKLATASLALVLFFAVLAIFADSLFSYDFVTSNSLENSFLKPGEAGVVYFHDKEIEHRFILGSDNYGRDILGRIIHGARVSMVIGFVTVALALVAGGVLGAVAGYKGGLGRHGDHAGRRHPAVDPDHPALHRHCGGPGQQLLQPAGGHQHASLVPGYIRIVRASIITGQGPGVHRGGPLHRRLGFCASCSSTSWSTSPAPIIVQSTLNVGSPRSCGPRACPSWGWASCRPRPSGATCSPRPGNSSSTPRTPCSPPGIALVLVVLAYNLIGDGPARRARSQAEEIGDRPWTQILEIRKV